MSDLPPGWAWARLDEIAEVRLGRQRSPKNHTGTHMRPYLRAANVDWGGLKLNDVKQMNFTDTELEVYRLNKNDILLTEASGSPDEVGKSAMWSGEISDCCFQNTLIRVRPQAVDPGYLHKFLTLEALRKAFVEDARGVGINHLGSSRLSSWRVPVPPLLEQRRVDTSVDDYTSRLGAADRLLSRAAQRLANVTVLTLVNARQRALDSGAELRAIGSIAETSLGKMLDAGKNSGVSTPYLANVNVRWGSFDIDNLRRVALDPSEADKFRVRRGDVLVCEGGEPGRCAVWRSDRSDVCYQKALHRVRVSASILPEWFALMLSEAVTCGRVDRLLTGTTIKHLPQQQLRKIQLPVPSIDVQSSILREVDETCQACVRAQTAVDVGSTRSANLSQDLLAAAFRGELVDQDPNDEPADVLLARIRAGREAAGPKKKFCIRRANAE